MQILHFFCRCNHLKDLKFVTVGSEEPFSLFEPLGDEEESKHLLWVFTLTGHIDAQRQQQFFSGLLVLVEDKPMYPSIRFDHVMMGQKGEYLIFFGIQQ